MNEDTRLGIRFCDEYEALLGEFLKTLAALSQLQSFFPHPMQGQRTVADIEVGRTHHRYAAAVLAVRSHTRECLICKETLRVRVNGGEPVSRINAN
jgi:hypothetical protein